MSKKLIRQNAEPEISELIARVDKENPKPEDVTALRRLLESDAALIAANDLAEKAFTRLFESISKSNAMREVLVIQLRNQRKALGYGDANAFVKMLIDQVIICQVRLNELEMSHTVKLEGTHNRDQGIYWDKRLGSAQRRFFRACETLAKVRKLLADVELKEAQVKSKSSREGCLR